MAEVIVDGRLYREQFEIVEKDRTSLDSRTRLAAAIALCCITLVSVKAQAVDPATERSNAFEQLLHAAKDRPFYTLDWHQLRLAIVDDQSAARLKHALSRSGRSTSDVQEQSLWVDAAAGHHQAALAFYDANAASNPNDKTLLNAACWARAAHGIDLEHVMTVCDAAVAADRQSHTLVHRGKAALQLGLFQNALTDFDAALADEAFMPHPMRADAVFGRGVARVRLGDVGGRVDIGTATRMSKRVATDFADIGIVP
ncbi:MAG: hypothetical protein KF730_01235 [Sphingomonas sp.]|uniref:hypothetical protein n=1 Tax=Sphingomonas sp. TaxID=28214 RepID=UPI0025EDDAF7|nr:hypothetical protein [Sphingomonas sp.]MBX3563175.1 hypothetical protein [Sphingomonas sp.]